MERGRFYQQFGETSGGGKTGSREVQTSRKVPQEQSWYEQDIPHEQIVSTLRHFMAKESARYKTPIHQFPTAEWLADELDTQAERSANSGAPREEHAFFHELKIAWQAVAYPQFGRSLRGIAGKEIEAYIQSAGSTSVALHPKAVKLFDAMAEVAKIPRKRGQATVDLTAFIKRDAIKFISFE
jgi:hypothetical protein